MFREGKHSFEVNIIKNQHLMHVGVVCACTDNTQLLDSGGIGESGQDWCKDGFSYHNLRGKYHSGERQNYGDIYFDDVVIKCEVDFDRNEITFYKNGKSQGVAFKNQLGGAVMPAVSLGGKDTILKIQNVM